MGAARFPAGPQARALTARTTPGARLRYPWAVLRSVPRFLAAVLAGLATVAAMPAAGQSPERLSRIVERKALRVCIWPDYYGISFRNPKTGQLAGFDIDLARAFAKDLGVAVEFVDSSFPALVRDLDTDRCDVAMFAVGKLPARLEALDFTQDVLASGLYGIATKAGRVVREWADIDRPGVRVAVQAGTFMEPVMRERLRLATLVVVSPPRTREEELESGRVDVFLTDYPYSRRLIDNADWARLVEPPPGYYRLPYGYAVKKGQKAWLARVDAFVSAAKADGRLREAARRHGLEPILAAP